MARVFITGGAGFIGSHIAEAMLAEGHQVGVADNLSSGSLSNLPAGVEFREIDIRDRAIGEHLRAFEPDLIVHTAAQMSVTESMKDPVFDADVNLCGLLNLLHSFEGKALPYWVFLSTGGAIYGEQERFPADESHRIEPTSVYGTAKRASELYLGLWQRTYGLKFAALRLANVYGPRQNPHGEAGVVAIFNQRLLDGKTPLIFGDGSQTRDFVFVKDVARAALMASREKVCGTFNIGTGRETSVNRLYDVIRESLGSKTEAEYRTARTGEQLRSCIDAALARRTFGWEPQFDIEHGLRLTSEWFRGRKA